MKKTLIMLTALSSLFLNAQWSLTGNSGTNPNNNFLGTTDNQDLVFRTNNQERLKMKNDGKIIFGDNNGVVNSNSQFSFMGIIEFNTIDQTHGFTIYDDFQSRFRVDSDFDNVFIQENNDGYTIIGSNVIPNCSDCNQYKLFVKDGIRTEKVKVDIAANNGWADYVFKKDYKLMPLKELDKFISTNGHLPEVPTTEEAIKNGIELKEMNILLLKKIEELTLYTIEQQKRIEALEKKLSK
ncbi:hypothetical protein HIO71_15755 [Chryseobacterium aquaticum]|uniref:Cell wall anchor protein n=1 Tax=Chryseobacterium aquaticum TaxID=452084 RepID=A0A848NDQ2_9FLAO|nr:MULTISPECIES: hypothetical protein [Chryseobacterium]NMR35633.1 hypothetical protein [Chryseobacterium aquaticum]NRQ47708.1 hypothetical protein [Chryseobacterium sp. C-204]